MDFKLKLSDEEFERLMSEIDERMVSENVRIPARQIRGWMLFCEKQQLHGISFTHPISSKVMEWFHARYGSRINLNFDLGHSVEIIRGDLLHTRCFTFFGRLHVICHPALMGRPKTGPAVNQPAVVNLLDQAEGMTVAFARSLTLEERQTLLRDFVASQVYLSRIADAGTQALVPEARADLRESVDHMTRHEGRFGMSKWASLQAVEKFLKAYILQQGTAPQRIHVLEELASKAESLGLRAIRRTVLNLAVCSPSARYDASSVSRGEAVEGYRAAVSICGDVATQLNGRSAWRTEVASEGIFAVKELTEEVPTILLRRFSVKSPLHAGTSKS
jgi:HEPN domain-containing protein